MVFVFLYLSSVQFSCSVMSNFLQPHESQHAISITITITISWSSLRLYVHRVGDAIQPSHPLSSPSPPAPNPSQHQSFAMSQLFAGSSCCCKCHYFTLFHGRIIFHPYGDVHIYGYIFFEWFLAFWYRKH